jgi:hypothetical protein
MAVGGLLVATGGLGGWAVTRLQRPARCSCGHGYGCVDKFTSHCTATVVETNWISGVRRVRKRVPCACKEHRQNTVRAINEVTP